MKESDIIKYIETPSLLNNADTNQFQNLVKKYPFYQTVHILLLKSLSIQYPNKFEEQLQESSVYISDRDLLFKFLNKEFKSETIEADVSKIIKQEIGIENTVKEEQKLEDEPESKKAEPLLLRNKDVKRRINDTLEGMGENISDTISSQIEFSVLNGNEKLEYPSEIYFIEEERSGKNNIITIDADPEDIKKARKKSDILQIDDIEKGKGKKDANVKNDESKDSFELIESDQIIRGKSDKKQKKEYFDISDYANKELMHENEKEPDLISKFIEKNPRIKQKETHQKIEEKIKDVSEDSVNDNNDLLSETLIKVYIKQGLFDRAIESYKKLSLIYPEKNTYFASQIKILEEKINKQ